MKLKNKKFVFEISIDAVPHTKATAEEIYGKNAYNSDFGVESHAIQLVDHFLRHAVAECMMAEMEHTGKCKCDPKDMSESDRGYHEFLQLRTKHAEEIAGSLKFVRVEQNKP